MVPDRAPREFDRISEVYDATREPLEPAVAESLAQTMGSWGIHEVLEVGVGTGRIAGPLGDHGFAVTGLDASRGMLAKARGKGLQRLVRGSAYRLPVAEHAVDATLFVHVLHVLERPVDAIVEACRVSRRGAVALVRPPGSDRAERRDEPSARRIVIELLRADGVPLPDRAMGGPPVRERVLLTEHPPQRLVVLREQDVTEPLADQLKMFEQRASRWALDVPPEKMARAVAEARLRVGDRTHTYHSIQALALWERAPTPSPQTPASGPPGDARPGALVGP